MLNKIILHLLKYVNYNAYAKKLGVKMGKDCRLLGRPNFGTEPYLVSLGNHVSISAGTVFLTHEGAHWVLKGLNPAKYNSTFGYGKIQVGNNVYIGYKVTLLRGITIGDNTIIGACSLVNKSLAGNGVYAGVPAKYICSLQQWEQKFMADMPAYDKENYRLHKQDEVLKIVEKFRSR